VASVAMAQEFVPPMPDDLERTRISLQTVGLGTDLYARYGHTMLRIEDPSHNLDYLVNWGIFDFSDPMFVPKFFRGILIYKMGFSGTKPTIRYYEQVERRSVDQDELALTSKQKRALMEKIIWNAQPENVDYPYQYFRNNCATKPRDYLDTVLGGAVSRQFSGEKTSLTYRDYVRSNLSNNMYVAWGLDIIFNGDNDHLLSKWEEMFYPLKLREYLAQMRAVDDEGRPDPGNTLLLNHRVLVDIPSPAVSDIDGYKVAWLVAGLPLGALLISLLARARKGDRPAALPWHHRVFGIVTLWWGLTVGFFGLTHFSGWAFSSHTDLHRNINILLFWPVEMLVLTLGVQMGILGRGWNFKGRLRIGFWRKFAIIHIIFIPIYAVAGLSGIFAQDVSRVVGYMAPLSLLYYVVMARLTEASSSN
jgi:hypothetical protein